MRYFNSKLIAIFLILIMLFHLTGFAILGTEPVRAGFWDEQKDNIFTVIKAMLMLWILNIMRDNLSSDSSDNLITSVIKDSLNLESGVEENKAPKENNNNTTITLGEKETAIIDYGNVTDQEFEILKLINQVRQEENLNLLGIDMDLTRIARIKALRMINESDSADSGIPFDLIQEAGLEYYLLGENLISSWTIDEAFQFLMEDREKQANILNTRYDRVGIGIVEQESGQLMIVQLFVDSPEVVE